MSKYSLSISVVLALLLSAARVNAQWEQLDVGQPGLVQAVAVIDGDVFAGTMAGLYRSYDYGTSWTQVSSAFAYCFASEGSQIFAGTHRNGVLRSTDGGLIWTQTDTGFNKWIMALAVRDTDIFAGGAGMFRSSDDGAGWTTIENGLGSYYGLTITGIVVDGSKLFATSSAGLLLSTDNGDTWSNVVSSALPSERTNCIAIDDSVIIIGTTGGMVRSTDDGITWDKDDTGLQTAAGFYIPVLSLAVDGNLILAGTSAGLYVSSDSGASWHADDNGLPENQVWSIAVQGTSIGPFLYAATNNSGVYQSVDNGNSWFPTGGISTSLATAYSICGYGSFVCALVGSGVYSSSNNGTIWTPDTNLPDWGSIFSTTAIDSSVYALTDSGIFLSTDSARTWSLLRSVAPAYIAKAGPNLIAFQNNGIYYSADGGSTWARSGDSPSGVGPLAVSDSAVVAAADSGIYLSNDNGETWVRSNNGPANITSLAAEGSDIIAGRFLAPFPVSATPGPPGGLFLSKDNGQTWSSSVSGLPSYPQVYAVAIHEQRVFVGLEGLESVPATFYSSDAGGSIFHNESNGLPLLSVRTIYVNDSSVFVGEEDGGIWRAPLSQVTVISQPEPTIVPTSIQLDQNYPNPFNPTTTIDYSIPARSQVTLKVYNVLGENVETLVDAIQQAGSHTVNFNASRLASGVYFYRLRVGNAVENRKLMLIK